MGSLPCTWKGPLGAVLHPAERLSAPLSFPGKALRSSYYNILVARVYK